MEKTYTADEVCAMFGISRSRLSHLTNGRNSTRNGVVEWNEQSALEEGADFVRVIDSRRLFVKYTTAAIDKLRTRYTQAHARA